MRCKWILLVASHLPTAQAIFLGVITGSSAIMATMDAFVVKEAEWQAFL